MLLPQILALLVLAPMAMPEEKNQFFAMDTIARGQPDQVVPMLCELGYAGLGGAAGDAAMAQALSAEVAALKNFNRLRGCGVGCGDRRAKCTPFSCQGSPIGCFIAPESFPAQKLKTYASIPNHAPQFF